MLWVIAWTISLIGIASAESSAQVIKVKTGADVVLVCDTKSNGKDFELINWNLNSSKTPIFAKFMKIKTVIDKRFSRRLHLVNNSAILLSSVTPSDTGTYSCKTMVSLTEAGAATLQYGTPIKLIVEVVLPFFIKQPPRKVDFNINSVLHKPIECLVDGFPKPNVEWYRLDGNEIPIERATVTSTGLLNFKQIRFSDAGRYVCYASNRYGSVKHEFDINVTRTRQPLPSNRKTAEEGKTKVLHCSLDGSAPTTGLHYTWTKDGKNIMSAPQSSRLSIILDGSLYIKSTQKTDTGVYKCIAKALDATGTQIVSYPGSDIFLDVQYVPSIIVIKDVETASQGLDVRLPCVSKGNPPTVSASWSRRGTELEGPRFAVLQEGSLLIRDVKTSDAGSYICTPSNKVGKGISKSTRLEVKIVPRFTIIPPSIKAVRLGDDVHLECAAVSDVSPTVTVTWIRVGESLPQGRTSLKGGKLTITKTRRSDEGQYMCLASASEGIARYSTTITVLATPGAPNITEVKISGSSVTISWLPGHDGGYAQRFEVWYRKAKDDDFHWQGTGVLPLGVNSHTMTNVDSSYVFSVRGVNMEGPGVFSSVVEGKTGNPMVFLPEKPLPPTHVIVNITATGYYLSWNYKEVPGRPVVDKFVVEYRENSTSNAWIRVDQTVDGDKRMHLLTANLFEPEVVYEFRVYAFGNKLSEPAYAEKTYIIGAPAVSARKEKRSYIPIIVGVLGGVGFFILLGVVCFCIVHYHAKRTGGDKSSKKMSFLIADGKSRDQSDITEEDYVDEEIKLHPEAVRFIPDKNIGQEGHWRRKITKEDDFFLLSSCDHMFGVDKLEHSPARITLEPTVTSPDRDRVTFFGSAGPAGWYDCTLGRPASNEVRDSYDQFCRSPNDIGSRDSLDRDALKRALYEHQGSKMHLVKKFDGSNNSLLFDKAGRPIRGPRYKHSQPDPNDPVLKASKNNPHHWSLPAVYSHHDANRDSDSDSVSSLGRRRRRMNRPLSFYDGRSSLQRELVPITEQDSDPNLRCSCEEDENEEASKLSNDLGRGSESSYLHLERNDSLKKETLDELNRIDPPKPFMDRLKSWDEESDGSVPGKPYGPHPKLTDDEALQSLDSNSDHSVSPAHSLASLTDSDVDGEISRQIDDALDHKRLSLDTAKLHGIPYMKHIDIDTASDISDINDPRRKVINGHLSLPDYLLPRDITLKNGMHVGSFDQLKDCDPYYQRKRGKPPSRTPSNASSGIYSVQVSSSETNSVDSPIISRRHSKGSARSSATSSGFESSSTRVSLGYDIPPPFETCGPSRAIAMRNLHKHRFPYLEEPYEWDRDNTGSEFESGSEAGHSGKPNVLANMNQLMQLQQRLGVDLDSGSSNESLSSKSKLEKMTLPEIMDYSPDVNPPSYEVDNYSTEEKDKRCSKLMDEFKANKKVLDERLNGSVIYQSWDL